MGMSGAGSSGAVPNINVTPLIDVLLVLLIIFMIIAPSKPSRFKAQVPAEPKPEDKTIAKPNPLTLVVSINGVDKKVTLNNEDAGTSSNAELLTNKLNAIFKERAQNGVIREGTNELERTVFIKAPKSLNYGEVVKVIDAVKIAQADPIGLQIDDLAN
jgi:biopolymer transport protein TolR